MTTAFFARLKLRGLGFLSFGSDIVETLQLIHAESESVSSWRMAAASSLEKTSGCETATEQFQISDTRSAAEIATMLRSQKLDPVWKDWDEALMAEPSGVAR